MTTNTTNSADGSAGAGERAIIDGLLCEQTYISSDRERCHPEYELPRWDRIQAAIDYISRAAIDKGDTQAGAFPAIKGAWIDGGYVIVTPAGTGNAPALKEAILKAAAPQADGDTHAGGSVPVEFKDVDRILKGGDGEWQPCSGCHETEDGHPVGRYPYSGFLKCDLGAGCSECGGLGAVWHDYRAYEAMGAELEASDAQAEGGKSEAVCIREDASNPDLEEIRAALTGEFKPMFPELQDVTINGCKVTADEVLNVARKTMGGVSDNEKGILMFVRALLAAADRDAALRRTTLEEVKKTIEDEITWRNGHGEYEYEKGLWAAVDEIDALLAAADREAQS
jgi:hypothetical protein